MPLTSLKQNSVKSEKHRSDIDFEDPFERGCSNDVFLNNRGVPKQWNLVASHIPKTKLGKSEKHRSDIDFEDPFERGYISPKC